MFSNLHRIATAWRKFHALKQELTGPRYSQSDRLRLFNGTITPTILYGCEAWTLTADLENRLRRTQRQMIRMIVRVPRRTTSTTGPQTESQANDASASIHDDDDNHCDDDDDDSGCDVDSVPPDPTPAIHDDEDTTDNLEPWVEWIQRATHKAEETMAKLNINDWPTTVRQRKWQWVRKVSTTGEQEWTRQVIQWAPQLDPIYGARRRAGRPKSRWIDDIRRFICNKNGCDDMDISEVMNIASTDYWDIIGPEYTTRRT